MSIDALLDEVSRKHFPNPPATQQEIEEFERRMGWRLDPDLLAFYLHCNGADLFRRPNSPYQFLPLSEIVRGSVAIFGKDSDSLAPPSLYAICDLMDGDYVMIDVNTRSHKRYPIIDGWHEAFPDPKYCTQIAESFEGFLEKALHSDGFQFWLGRRKE
jgi:hypothetical protein